SFYTFLSPGRVVSIRELKKQRFSSRTFNRELFSLRQRPPRIHAGLHPDRSFAWGKANGSSHIPVRSTERSIRSTGRLVIRCLHPSHIGSRVEDCEGCLVQSAKVVALANGRLPSVSIRRLHSNGYAAVGTGTAGDRAIGVCRKTALTVVHHGIEVILSVGSGSIVLGEIGAIGRSETASFHVRAQPGHIHKGIAIRSCVLVKEAQAMQ